MYAFVALLWKSSCSHAEKTAEALISRCREASPEAPSLRQEGLFVIDLGSNAPHSFIPLAFEERQLSGAVFGTLFRKDSDFIPQYPITALDAKDRHAIEASEGANLAADFWGSYILFYTNPDFSVVVTDPTSAIPCFYLHYCGVTVVLSHLEKCPFTDLLELTLNLEFASSLIAYDKIQNGQTGFREIRELPGGNKLTIRDDEVFTELLWDPRRIAETPMTLNDQDTAEYLRKATHFVVKSWSNVFDRVDVHLSGGLDSTIVLGCLTGDASALQLRAIHNIAGQEELSELPFAREAADFYCVPLTEHMLEPAVLLPRPQSHPKSVRPYRQFLTPDLRNPASYSDATPHAVFTGQGGDHLFLASRSILGFADFVRNFRGGGGLLQTLLDTASLSDRSVWEVLWGTLRELPGPRAPQGILKGIERSRTPVSDLAHDRLQLTGCVPDWAEFPDGLPPGKFDQVSRLLHLYMVRETLDRPVLRNMVHPLISQPLIELCLRIPVWQLCLHGINRGLAREAFRAEIPDTIRNRLTKGETTRFFMEQIRLNRQFLADTLSEGALAAHGLIDPETVRSWIMDEAVDQHPQGRRLLVYYTIECWMRRWTRL
ncbi:MAG: hypothetical protein B7X55_04245 [Rhodobacterales bacterium 34-62-10]|nr:MAG: hypothetical protein B7X55_04245 [Rhodobacterales bacterium 34-62-10]